MATPDFGTCLAVTSAWPRIFVYASGLQNLGLSLCRRLQTIRGSLPWDPDCGYDLRQLLRGSLTQGELARMEQAISAECEKDERVDAADASITYAPQSRALRVAITIDTAAGPFALIVSVDQVTVELLSISAAGAQ
jgi:hypothetical protein